MIEKLDMKTMNFTDDNIAKIAEIFPNVVSEDENGKVIDFDALKQELSDNIVDGYKERYSLNWPGKREAQLTANTPTTKTLRPCKEESVDFQGNCRFDKTENLYIEGDNLEVLKILQESYLNKIKMIYIDPPYNTGKDFVYKDNFVKSSEKELLESGQINEEGGKLVANLENNGRYHSDWLSMMYPRLRLAKNLLKIDGVIFISIDDSEITNLSKICDEVFGESNFVSKIIINRASEIASNNTVSKHEYLLCYAKDSNLLKVNGTSKYTISRGTVGNADQSMPIIKFPAGLKCVNIDDGTYPETRKIDGSSENIENFEPIIVENGYLKNSIELKAKWRSSNDMRNFFNNNCQPTEAKISGIIEEIYFDGTRFMPQIKKATYEKISSLNLDVKRGSKDLEELDLNFFPFPKSSDLIKTLIKYFKFDENDIVLDFFSGSGTTAHSVMKLNSEDNGNRKFIMVQLPEDTDEKSAAYKAGYKTIPEIGKERIRRAGKKIIEESGKTDLDIGFRVLKLDSSNMKDVYFNPNDISQDNLFDTVDNIKEDRSELDLLFGVLIDWGVDLTLPITKESIKGKDCYFVDEDSLCACFENDLDEEFIKELAKKEMLRVVFRDSGFASDDVKDNVSQIFKQLNENCDIKVI